jgi:hypothetical protein
MVPERLVQLVKPPRSSDGNVAQGESQAGIRRRLAAEWGFTPIVAVPMGHRPFAPAKPPRNTRLEG